tara:strand:+ start:824 stop:1546 length:723 start_codon:yes stop_codon:yes gene_type:complete
LELAIFIIFAYLTATLSGFIGMAGGTMLLALMLMSDWDPTIIVPVHAGVQLISNSTRVYAHLSQVRWKPFGILAACAAPFPLLGLWLLEGTDPQKIRMVMGLVILYAAWVPKWGLRKLTEPLAFGLAGIMGGTLGVVVGAVGPLIAPFFLSGAFVKRQIIATKAMCQTYLHLLKILAFTTVGFVFLDYLELLVPMGLASIAGTYTGKWLLGKISEEKFIYAYKAILTLLALRLIVRPFLG